MTQVKVELLIQFSIRALTIIGKVSDVLNTSLRIDADFYRMITAAFRAIIRVTEIEDHAISGIDITGFNFLV